MTQPLEDRTSERADRADKAASARLRAVSAGSGAESPASPRWKSALERLQGRSREVGADPVRSVFATESEAAIVYLLNLRETKMRDQLVVDFSQRGADGLRPVEVDDAALEQIVGPDREILRLLLGNAPEDRVRVRLDTGNKYSRSGIRPAMYDLVLPLLSKTHRFELEAGLPEERVDGPLSWDSDPWGFELLVERSPEGMGWRLWGRLSRRGEFLDLGATGWVLSSGLFMYGAQLARVEGDGLDWLYRLRKNGPVLVPFEAKDDFLLHLASMANLPELQLPPELHWSQVRVRPTPRVSFTAETSGESKYIMARVTFDYGGQIVLANARQRAVADGQGRQLFRRDIKAEMDALRRLKGLGLQAADDNEGGVRIAAKDLQQVIKTLVDENWFIEADGQPIRGAGALRSKVNSGIDWFDLEAELDFGGVAASLPELLQAAHSGAGFVLLKDGSKGLVPDWLNRYASFAQTGRVEGGRLRFAPSQAGIIDALLFGSTETQVDIKFERILKSLRKAGSMEVPEPTGFKGKLRDYQRQGLAWMRSLESFEYHGCLADDMGLGKTVQVLSLLQGRHRPGGVKPEDHAPSLIVVPRSLIFNWISEAAKFAPDLKSVNYTGAERLPHREKLNDYDLIVTTYGTLRQDILNFLDIRFNTVVLDEAQAIKNPSSQAAKACRLLQSRYRLAISGTPIENSLEELWSIFEFLNPGMLGPAANFSAGGKERDEEWLQLLSTSLKPFMLRRTKEQVLTELPGKTEQLLMIDLEPEERRRYDELRDYYRTHLTTKIGELGWNRSKIHVLEALLRLRQAACHPGLVDPTRMDDGSTKMDLLVDKIETLAASGHKALIFSQFTKLLEIARRALVRRGIKHQYLDGATRDRKAACDQFQGDPDCKAFLISLKAGGCGLNLTSSDYVFILDPWWNPAVEAQAIDRSHRMGQKRPVFAYRLIARDTVEEKIVALQDDKRRLADAIVTGERQLIRELSEADLEKLFA